MIEYAVRRTLAELVCEIDEAARAVRLFPDDRPLSPEETASLAAIRSAALALVHEVDDLFQHAREGVGVGRGVRIDET